MNQIGEFNLIQKYFENRSQPESSHLVLGIGDDAAVTAVPSGKQLVSTMDTLIAGRHFPIKTHPSDIAYKSLAVNVSDLCAMGADPAWFLLSLSLPEADEEFLRSFADGLFEAANQFGICLIGGDTCKGPTSVSIQATGLVEEGCFITRRNAKPGDTIYVSGVIGSAALGLELINLGFEEEETLPFRQALNRPNPRTDLIPLIRDYATASIDISDGLIADLGHILERSQVGATIHAEKIPVPLPIRDESLLGKALTGGDDYQLVFCVGQDHKAELENRIKQQALDIAQIGEITEKGYSLQSGEQVIDLTTMKGFEHFG